MAESPKTPATITPQQARLLVQKLRQTGETAAAAFRARGLINESFYTSGENHFPENGRTDLRDPGGLNGSEITPTIPVNYFTNLINTWQALLTADRPTSVAVPATDEASDIYRALLSQSLIEHCQEDLGSYEVIVDAVTMAGLHGSSSIKVTYDEDEHRVNWAVCPIYNFLIDPVADWKKARWVLFIDNTMSVDEAQDLFDEAGIDRAPTEKSYSTPGASGLVGVEHIECWVRPSREYPEGLYLGITDGEVIEIAPYPYCIERRDGTMEYPLPLSMMRCRKVRDSVFGGTPAWDLVPLQRAVTETANKIQKLLRQVTNIHLVLPASLQETLDPSTATMIGFPDEHPPASGVISYTRPGEISESLFRQEDRWQQKMMSVIGLNDVVADSANPHLSGTAIDAMHSLDKQRNASVVASMQAMILDAWDTTLKLIGAFMPVEKIAKLTNSTPEDVADFIGSGIRSDDVKLQIGTEIDSLQPAKEKAQSTRVNEGIGTPLDLKRATRSSGYAISKARAEKVINDILVGRAVQMSTDDIEPDVLNDVIRKAQAHALSKKDRAGWARLESFARSMAARVPPEDIEPQAAE